MSEFPIGTLVWAKLASYPYWPGRVTRIKDVKDKEIREQLGTTPPNTELVWFFGSRNYGWVPAGQIVAYNDGYEEKSKNKRAKLMKGFTQALKEAETWKEDPHSESEGETVSKKKLESPKESKHSKSEDKKEETSRKKKEDDKKREDKVKLKEEEKKKKKDDEDKKKKNDNRRHSDPGSREKKKEDEKLSKKRKASDDEEDELPFYKKAKLANSNTPIKKESEKLEQMDTEVVVVAEKPQLEVSEKKTALTEDMITKAIEMLKKHPVSKYNKLDFIRHGDGSATAKASFSDARPHSKYEVHAVLGATYFLLEITCYAALLSHLHDGESAITQDINVSVLHPIPQGSEVTIKARIIHSKPKTGLIFLEGEVWLNSKLMVVAKVIKSLLDPDLPIKEVNKEDKIKEKQ